MGLFPRTFGRGFERGVEKARATEGARIVDVRERDEYAGGHLDGAINIPLSGIDAIKERIPGLDTPVFLYCASGSRSGRAAGYLKRLGYAYVTNMGGLMSYPGPLVR